MTASQTTRRTFARGDEVWSIELDGRAVKVRSEAPGAEAEDTTRHSPNPAAAWRDADSLIAAKLRDGYVEIVA